MGEPIRVKGLDPTLRDEVAELLNGYNFSNCLTCGIVRLAVLQGGISVNF